MANVVIKRRVAAHNVDSMNRTAKASVALENGSVVMLNTRSTVDGENEVWVASQPTATSVGVWMVKSSEVVTTTVGSGVDALNFRGIVEDPRHFTNVAGLVFDAFKPEAGDIIEMTLGADENGDYLNVAASYTLATASSAGNGFSMKKVGTGILHIGNAGLNKTPVKTYIYEVAKN